jgi:hypothetical protein
LSRPGAANSTTAAAATKVAMMGIVCCLGGLS